MNPWDLSCRSKLPIGDLNEHRTINDKDTATSTHLPLPNSLTASILAYSTISASPSATSPSASSSSFSSSTSNSLSSSPPSSRSNSIETRDGIHLERLLLAGDIINTVSESSGNKSLTTQQENPSLDRNARKKDQNRRAAYNYRRKKIEEKNRMREEEMRLVYSRVCLIGYAEELEGSIMYILNTKTRKILDKDGNSICYLCPICLQSCDNILNLRSHLNVIHYSNNGD